MVTLPKKYAWLKNEDAPKVLVEALKLFGTREIVGPQHSADIMGWAKQVGLSRDYTADEIPWCGLFAAVVAKNAGYDPVALPLWALNWRKWGVKADNPKLGDILVFNRLGGGHVGIYVGEDEACYHVLGGNQGNCVSIVRIERSRLVAARRSPFKWAQPANVRRVKLNSEAALVSQNEA